MVMNDDVAADGECGDDGPASLVMMYYLYHHY